MPTIGVSWVVCTLVICIYGLLKEFRPITPFLAPVLQYDMNLTIDELYGEVFPYWTYSYLVFLIPVLLLSDLVTYNVVIVSEALAYVATWALLIWSPPGNVAYMQVMQTFYGWATATEVAYYAYIYAVIEPKFYKRATSYVRGAILAGRCIAYTVGQMVLSLKVGTYMTLNYISLGSMLCIMLIATVLPRARRNRSAESEATCAGTKHYFVELRLHLSKNYKKASVLKWSLWWAFATCGSFQVGNYIQTMWQEISHDKEQTLYNGITEAVSTLLSATVAFGVQFLHVNWHKRGELFLAVISAVGGILLICISQTNNLVLAYCFYVVFCVLYHMLITVATYNVASDLEENSYGLIFGCNTFLALLVQTILTLVFADKSGFNLAIRTQFIVYGIYFALISCLFLLMTACSCYRQRSRYYRGRTNSREDMDNEQAGSVDLLEDGSQVYSTLS